MESQGAPDLSRIGNDAAKRKPGVSARDYLADSPREPGAFASKVADRILMPSAIHNASLNGDNVLALVEFLLALK